MVLDDEELDAGRSRRVYGWHVFPGLVAKDGRLVYPSGKRPPLSASKWIDRRDSGAKALLEGFAELKDADDSSIASFANRWGLLGLCEHGLPRHDGCEISGTSESIAVWKALALAADAAVEIAQGSGDDPVLWDRVLRVSEPWSAEEPLPMPPRVPKGTKPVQDGHALHVAIEHARTNQRAYVAGFVNTWLEVANVRPAVLWGEGWMRSKDDPPEIILHGGDLLGALGVQLLGAVSRKVQPSVCDICGAVLNRLARRGRRNFCQRPLCKKRGLALRQKDYRGRVKAQAKTAKK